MRKAVFFLLAQFLSLQLTACQGEDIRIGPDNDVLEETSEYMAIFGDIQYYTNAKYIDLYKQSLNWINQQKDSGKKIKCILHTGDICGSPNETSHWNCFDDAMTLVSNRIPYYSMIGDHDYTWYDGTHINSREDTHFNEHVQFPLSIENVVEQFESGRMENVVIKNIIQGERLDLLILEFGPRKEVIEWANTYVKAHPYHKFILMTHEYLEKGGGRRVKGLKMVARLQNTTYTTPKQIWEGLVKCNDNILCVLCGHVGGLYALTVDTNDFGREVPQIQYNIQGPEYRYDNLLMMWEFPAEGDSANVFIYNTKTDKYFNDTTSLFKFKYRN